MKLFLCDWCNQQKPCRPLAIDAKTYDVCPECHGEIELKLKGKGETVANPLRQIAEELGKQKPWPCQQPWTLGQPPLLTKTSPAIYGPQIIGKSDADQLIGGGIGKVIGECHS